MQINNVDISTANSMDYGPRRLRPIEYGPRRKRTMFNAAHILLQNPRTDVRGELIFICFKRSTCNCFHTFHNEIMYNVYIII